MSDPQWREPQPSDHGKYAFIESLPSDAPPMLLRSKGEVKMPVQGVDCTRSLGWQYWTTAGWVDLKTRVCVCERPSE